MPEFAYTARTASGQNVAGTMTAASKREMLRLLGEKALFPLRVETAAPKQAPWQGSKRIKPQVVATNLMQLADLLRNGVPLLTALEILRDQAAQRNLAEILGEIRDLVAEGTALDQAMGRYPLVFSELTISMVRAGTEGAFLEDALKRTADFLDLQEQLKGRIVGALTYPAFLGVAGFLVIVVLLVFFVPKFAELFARLERQGGGLPTATVALLAMSDFLGRYGVFVAAGVAALVAWLRRLLKTPQGRLFSDRWKLKIPLLGAIFLTAAVSRFCRVLGTLLHNGVPLLKSLDISSESAGNKILGEAIRASAQNISSGESLSKPLAACGLIPRPIMAMIAVAEESNNLDQVLVNVADRLDQDISRRLDIIVRLIEPLMLLVMGVIILFVLVALLMPVFDMSSAIG